MPGPPPKDDGDYPLWIKLAFKLLKTWLYFYDLLAYVPVHIFANPRRKLTVSNCIKAKPLDSEDVSSPYRRVSHFDKLLTQEFDGCDTLDKIWLRAVKLYPTKECLGTRAVISVEEEAQSDGKFLSKFVKADTYTWKTYEEVHNDTEKIGSALLRLNITRDDRVVIVSETRSEWMTCALTCLRYQFQLVTLYPTLSADGLVHGINEVEADIIFTSHDLAENIIKLVPHCPNLRILVYYPSIVPGVEPIDVKKYEDVLPKRFRIVQYEEILKMGEEKLVNPPNPPISNDIAMIMYTSGTTGVPKGVILTHSNVAAGNAGQCYYVRNLAPPDIYIGYLPAAHVLEFTAEFGSITHGVPVGYGSPLTLTDMSSKIKAGTKGDISILRPTLMAAVPTIMDRIYKAVMEKVQKSSPFSRALFHFCYERKRQKIENGYETPILNFILYRRIMALLGGRVRLMLSGGAPLNPETQRFINICFCCPVGQGYGLTETSGAGTVCEVDDISTGRCGPPLPCVDIMLRSWAEGGYDVTNLPHPQGEILFSGPNVTSTYYKNDQRNNEDFIELYGRRWFCTGDIGEIFTEDGTLKVIDRKKDLVKLQHGEYVSLAKVETALLTNPLVDNVCAYGNSMSNYMVALVVPNQNNLRVLAQKLNITSDNFDELSSNKVVSNAVLKELQEHGKKNSLEKHENPAKIHLCKEVWTVDSGLLTDAMKLKRKPLEKFYKDILKQLYGGYSP